MWRFNCPLAVHFGCFCAQFRSLSRAYAQTSQCCFQMHVCERFLAIPVRSVRAGPIWRPKIVDFLWFSVNFVKIWVLQCLLLFRSIKGAAHGIHFGHIPVGILRFRAVVHVTTHWKSLKTVKNHAKTMKNTTKTIGNRSGHVGRCWSGVYQLIRPLRIDPT